MIWIILLLVVIVTVIIGERYKMQQPRKQLQRRVRALQIEMEKHRK